MKTVNLVAQDQTMDARNIIGQRNIHQGLEQGMKRLIWQGTSTENESTSKRQCTDVTTTDGLGGKEIIVDEIGVSLL